MNEEEIIAQGFLRIREGVVNADWQKVVDGYGLVSGETLEAPKMVTPKTKLEKIRELMNVVDVELPKSKHAPVDTPDIEGDGEIPVLEMNKRQLQEVLFARGRTKTELADKKKSDLVEMVKALKTEILNGDGQEGSVGTTIKLVEGGDRFATNGFNIIQTNIDLEEQERNQKLANKQTIILPRTSVLANAPKPTDDPNRSWGFYDKPPKGPSWR